MAVLALPLSFNNSFWSQDYRKGLEVLFGRLEQGIVENEEIVVFITARAVAESQLASALLDPVQPEFPGTGFNTDDGASLLVTFRGLQSESVAQGQMHKSIAQELRTLVAGPFEEWAQDYKKRLIERKRAFFDVYIPSYEQAQGEVSNLKYQYLSKVRRADEAEEDAKFAPNTQLGDKYTASPKLRPHDRAPPQRSASVSDRIAQRLREIQNNSLGSNASSAQKTEESKPAEEALLPKVEKGKGKAVDKLPTPPRAASPLPLSPSVSPVKPILSPVPPMPAPPMTLAGLSLPPTAVSQLLTRAMSELPLRPIRVPVMGEYPDCFTGEEFVAWLRENVEGFGGSLDRAEDAARDLTERDGLLRRIGEFGNQFELSDDAFYQFRPKAFELGRHSENIPDSPKATLAPAGNLLKRTGTLVNYVSKVISGPTEPPFIRAREDAKQADQTYRVAARNLDRQRLVLEDRIEDTLKTLQTWEADRLRAIKSVLLQYQGTLSNIPKYLGPSIERSSTLIATYQPESDLIALIERYRTGSFRPDAQVYESVSHDEFDVVFGIDLRKWAEGGWSALMSDSVKKDSVPVVLTSLLAGLETAYQRLPGDTEKRKSWIYEVPLPPVHHLREALNALPSDQPVPAELMARYDAPIIANTLKLWLLELNPPLTLWEGWEEFRKLYPQVGSHAKTDDANPEEQHMQDLKGALQRLPMVHLLVLDLLLQHLRTLIDTTDVEETNEVYIAKLALSLGRTIIRPKFESEMSIQDRHPTLLFIDLLKNYADVIPPTIARKKRESERKLPMRKRTAPVDMRLSRSRISVDADPRQLLVAQQVAQNPTLARRVMSPERPHPTTTSASKVVPPPVEKQSSVKSAQAPLPAPPPHDAPIAPTTVDLSRPSFKEPAPENGDVPPRPTFKEPLSDDEEFTPRPYFKEPPPEDEDLPARPVFKEPPPEVDDTPRPAFREPEDLPARPSFKEPPPEIADDADSKPTTKDVSTPETPPAESPAAPVIPQVATTTQPEAVTPSRAAPAVSKEQSKPAEKPVSPPPVSVVPPTPQRHGRRSSGSFARNGSPSPPKGSRNSSPGLESSTTVSSPLARAWAATTGQSSLVRGPRLAAKGPRAPGGGSVSNMVANLNRNSLAGSPPSPGSPPPSNKRLSSPSPRSSFIFGRSGSLSRRTMASDAEDDVVDKK